MKKIIVKKRPENVLVEGKFTYINLYNYSIVREYLHHFDGVHFDGIGLLNIYRIIKLKKVKRFSSDNTSLMPLIKKEFNNFIVYGGKAEENIFFCSNFLEDKNLIFSNHGYTEESFVISKINEIIQKFPSEYKCIILIGLGSPKQELVASKINLQNKNITLLTIGGFISQYNIKADYFPKIIDKMNLRMPYRLFKENLWNRLPKYWDGFINFTFDLVIRDKIR